MRLGHLVEEGLEGSGDSVEHLGGQRSADVGSQGQPFGVNGSQCGEGGHKRGAVDQRQPFLRLKRHGPEPILLQRLGGRTDAAFVMDSSLSGYHRGQVRQRHQVAARPDRPLLGDHRDDVGVEQRQQSVDQLDAHGRVPPSQGVGPYQHCGAGCAQRRGLPGTVAQKPDQVFLQLRRHIGADLPLDGITETRGDSVQRHPSGHEVTVERDACVDGRPDRRITGEHNRYFSTGHSRDVLQAEPLTIHDDLSNGIKTGDRRSRLSAAHVSARFPIGDILSRRLGFPDRQNVVDARPL